MPISKNSTGLVMTAPAAFDQFLQTGVVRSDAFAIRDVIDEVKQIKFDASALASNTSVTISANPSNTGTFLLPPFSGGTLQSILLANQYVVPTTGQTITISGGTQVLALNPAGTLSALTVNFPGSASDGASFAICTTQTLTSLTLVAQGADTISGAVSTLAANAFCSYVYASIPGIWMRKG